MKTKTTDAFAATRNACKVCAPLGASLAFAGIKGAITLLHGSQGCSTYIRRYMISHFKEPIDIASSNFNESAVIFGGQANFSRALENLIKQYDPAIVGIATTCLAETIGDDVKAFISQLDTSGVKSMPELVSVSTPSFRGTHAEGFHAANKAVVQALARSGPKRKSISLFPGIISPEDIRYLKGVATDCAVEFTILSDYSETLDGQSWRDFHRIPPGGTQIDSIRDTANAAATIEFGSTLDFEETAGAFLKDTFGVSHYHTPLPIGVRYCDRFFQIIERLSESSLPEKIESQRGRLLDSYIDSHKYVFGKKAVVYGEEDLVVSIVSFLSEIGIVPVICATGAKTGRFKSAVEDAAGQLKNDISVVDGVDFVEIEQLARKTQPDIIIGNSKGYTLSKSLGIPLVRVGFPVHDRIGGGRIRHLGYSGTQALFDRIVNTIIEVKQSSSPVGYPYM